MAEEVPAVPIDEKEIQPMKVDEPKSDPPSKIIPIMTDPFARNYWQCPTCAKQFRSQYHVQKHMNTQHDAKYDLTLLKKRDA